MARGELMKKLLASYGRDDEFRAVAEQIITEEEKKNNLALAKTLRKTLEGGPSRPSAPKALAPLLPFPEAASDFIERIEPQHTKGDIVLSATNVRVLLGLVKEFRRGEDLRRHGLQTRSKVLFCGPPGCGKTLCAEIFAAELGLPFFVVKLDRLISSYLGETASNIRKIFEFARKQPCVLFFDEFDALARARDESGEHNELRRVVNSLLLFIDQIRPKGFLIAATNLDQSLDPAVWRRFDEVVWFERPDRRMIDRFLRMKFKNVATAFDPTAFASSLEGYSYAEIERVCIQAIKSMIVERRKQVQERDFNRALKDETRRRSNSARLKAGS
ncbi:MULTISPECIES: AAA family ATPase [Rhizobium]|nr:MULTISPECIES: ATP-binding protein [Rhizobium]NZD54976.1 ATP-binding protein [Rhizobium leguminosarum]RWX38189.1 ATP-binding protein [Rhizobium leguminosarum]TAW02595.1 ATP-binding protein [Rhizobium ruizarguesonis]TAY62755.1 ATP-binding protein [Rhizobium ruizarguesonis]TAZ43748.1 ATP-binding protein [Rhizobium ruizarguesonis]